jgi:hypothetical protein
MILEQAIREISSYSLKPITRRTDLIRKCIRQIKQDAELAAIHAALEAATLIASNTAPAELAVHQQFKYFENRTRDGLRIKMAGKNLRGIQ